MRRRLSCVFSEKSPPSNSLASDVHSQATARAGHSGGMCWEKSIWLTGLMPEALMARCMSVATEIGRAHVCTPVTNAHLVFRHLHEKKNITLNLSVSDYKIK